MNPKIKFNDIAEILELDEMREIIGRCTHLNWPLGLNK